MPPAAEVTLTTRPIPGIHGYDQLASRFTGYFRDSETGLDYAVNRYHQPGMGRFMTPDPYMASGGATDPGSWNRYAYVGGDPISFVDPAGEYMCNPANPGCQQAANFGFCDPYDPDCGNTCGPGQYFNPYLGYCQVKPGPINFLPPGQGGGGGGIGTVTVNKSYNVDDQCKKSAAALMGDIESSFSSFANYTGSFLGLTTTLGFNVPSGGISVGSVIQIPHTTYVAGVPITTTDSVTVTQVGATSFTFATNPGHPLNATITFTAQDMGSGFVGFSIGIAGQTANAFWSLFFQAGGSSFEDGVWNNFLDQVGADCSKKP